jgi:hypothetical protein
MALAITLFVGKSFVKAVVIATNSIIEDNKQLAKVEVITKYPKGKNLPKVVELIEVMVAVIITIAIRVIA